MASRAQIIATIGPASGTADIIAQMVENGMDAARLNFSHGTYEEHANYIRAIQSVGEALGRVIPIIQDLSGPRMKTGEGHQFDQSKEMLTEKDVADLAFGLEHGITHVAQSYVGTADDIGLLRSHIEKSGKRVPVIAKIEREEAVVNFDEILAAADAVMIARGDLGLAEPIEEIPFIQRDLTARANRAQKPVITATQMLLSMTENPMPTRAEVTDVVFAILAGSDALMLSEETARGKHPLEAIMVMERVMARAEKNDPSGARNVLS